MHKIRLKFLTILNKLLIPIFVRNEMYNFLSLLFILNLIKIKKILPKNKTKFKAVVLYRTGGIDDLIQSQQIHNKNILYLSCSREFFKLIFLEIFDLKEKTKLADFKFLYDKKIFTPSKRNKYKKFLISFINILKKKFNFDIFLSFNFLYYSERDLHEACQKLKIPFVVLFKESIHSEIQKKFFQYTYKKIDEKFNGYKIAVYSKYAKKLLIESNITNNKKIDVVGCSRLNESFSYRKVKPKNQIIYYAIQDNRGLPTPLFNSFGKAFFRELKYDSFFNSKLNWKKLHLSTIKVLKDFAILNPDIQIIIKIKNGEEPNKKEYLNLPNNIQIMSFGTGHRFLKNSKIVIGWNTTSVLEGIAANRFILIPYFHKKNLLIKKAELKLGLKKSCYVNSENDFINKLNYLIKKNYRKDKIYNNQYSLDYHLGNSDNKAGLRLNKFLKKNLNWN